MNSPDTPTVPDRAGRLLDLAVRLLPARRTEWGQAMRAELAGIDPGPARWHFALGCTRAVLTRPSTLMMIGRRTLLAGLVVAGVILAGQISYPGMRRDAIAMVLILTGLSWLAGTRAVFGPVGAGPAPRLVRAGGLAVLATETLLTINDMRVAPHGDPADSVNTLLAVWTAMMTIYMIAVVRLTARRASIASRTLPVGTGLGLAAALLWFVAALLQPTVPTTDTPAILVVGAVAVIAGGIARDTRSPWQSLLAALAAAATAALLIGVLVGRILPLFTGWVRHNHPPVYPTLAGPAPHRLVDSITMLLLGCLISVALSAAVRVRRTQPTAALSPTI